MSDINSIKKYHDTLWQCNITDKEKMLLTTIIVIGFMTDKFSSDYEMILLKDNIKNEKKNTPFENLLDISIYFLKNQNITDEFLEAINNSWKTLLAKTSLNTVGQIPGRINLLHIIDVFKTEILNRLNDEDKDDDFLGKLFAEISGRGANTKAGIVLTPGFIADVMTDLLELDYTQDVVFDGASGSGALVISAYVKMKRQIEEDAISGKITPEERDLYRKRLANSIYANDLDAQMALLTLSNFSMFQANIHNVSLGDFFGIDKNYIDSGEINKGILNPPYEYDPAKFTEELVSKLYNAENKKTKKAVVICPPNAFAKKPASLSNILKVATLKSIITVQPDTFVESGVSVGTGIFVYDVGTAHTDIDEIKYYSFIDSGYVYLKDSGLVDKNNTFTTKKEKMLKELKSTKKIKHVNTRTWETFYEVPDITNFNVTLDTGLINNKDKQEADVTNENQIIKKMLKEKKELIDSCNNLKENTPELEEYIATILSEDI